MTRYDPNWHEHTEPPCEHCGDDLTACECIACAGCGVPVAESACKHCTICAVCAPDGDQHHGNCQSPIASLARQALFCESLDHLDRAAAKREAESKTDRLAELVKRAWVKWLDARSRANFHLWHFRRYGSKSRLERANEERRKADRAWRWYEKLKEAGP